MPPIIVIVHAVSAALVLLLGPVNLLRRRRDRAHRIIGRTFVVAMGITCLSAFGLGAHGFSWLHLLAVWTLISMTLAVVAIRRGNLKGHRANMIGSYAGTVIAFGFAAFTPTRLIGRLALHEPLTLAGLALLLAALAYAFAGTVVATRGRRGARRTPQPEPNLP